MPMHRHHAADGRWCNGIEHAEYSAAHAHSNVGLWCVGHLLVLTTRIDNIGAGYICSVHMCTHVYRYIGMPMSQVPVNLHVAFGLAFVDASLRRNRLACFVFL